MIVIDCTSLSRKKTGIENYSEQLVLALIKTAKNPNSFTLIFSNNVPTWAKDKSLNVVILQASSELLLSNILIPFQILKLKPKKIIFPAFPPSIPTLFLRKILELEIIKIVYDGVMWMYPESISKKNKLYFKPLESLGINFYDKIATISDSSRKDLANLFPRHAKKFKNIGTALIKRESTANTAHPSAEKYKDRYFLFVGTLDFRKNIEITLEAFSRFKAEHPDFKFVIAGRSAWGSERLNRCIESLKLGNSVKLLGYVKDDQLESLYANATAFLFPSIYEGFGLPVVEAMYYQCPVIASNNSAIPEAAGGSAILVDDYYSSNAWLEKMQLIHDNPHLRNKLIKKGSLRVESLSWENVATKFKETMGFSE